MPFEEMISKVQEKSGIGEAEIRLKIDQKLTQLSGLISKEGALHIIANELGVKLVENSGKIKDIYPGMKNVELLGRTTQVYEVREFQRTNGTSGKVGNFMIGDETGTIKVVCWGSMAEEVKKITPGTIVKIGGGLVKENLRGYKEVHVSEHSKLIISPLGETVGEIKTNSNPTRKKIEELKENEDNIEVFGTIRQLFDLTFFEVCPQCSARTKMQEDGYKCPDHGKITPDYNYVLNVILDDGTSTVRVTCFRAQADKLLGKTKEELLIYREHPEAFEELKMKLLGEQYKFVGRTKMNTFSNRLEFNANLVFPGNPDEELKKMEEPKKVEESRVV